MLLEELFLAGLLLCPQEKELEDNEASHCSTNRVAELFESHENLDGLLGIAGIVDLVELLVALKVGEALAELTGLLLGEKTNDLRGLESITDGGLDGLERADGKLST